MEPVTSMESARRSLFGPVDHDKTQRELKQRLHELTEKDGSCWNFDFGSDAPLAGEYRWEGVPAHSAAPFYTRIAEPRDVPRGPDGADGERLGGGGGEVGVGVGGRGEDAGPGQENRSIVSNKPKCPADVTQLKPKQTHRKPAKLQSNTRITDFFPKKKKETKRVLNPLNSSGETCKSIR